MQTAQYPFEAVVAERLQEYLCNRITEAIEVLGEDSSLLASVLIEILEVATGDAELVGWRSRRSRPNGRGDGRKKLVALQKTAKTALLGVCGAFRRALARAVVVS